MDTEGYEHLKALEKKCEHKRLNIWKRLNIYHVIDIILHIILLLCCYNFNFVSMYKDEKGIFYSFSKSLVDIGVISLLKYAFTIVQHYKYSKIDKLKRLIIYTVISRHFSGIICLAIILKSINFNYMKLLHEQHNLDRNVSSLPNITNDITTSNLNYDAFVFTFRIIIVIYAFFSSVYFYFYQLIIFSVLKKHIITKNDIKKHYETHEHYNNINENRISTMDTYAATDECGEKQEKGNKNTEFEWRNIVITNAENNMEKKKDSNNKSDKFESNRRKVSYYLKAENGHQVSNKKQKVGLSTQKNSEQTQKLQSSISYDYTDLEHKMTFKEFGKILLPYIWPSKRVDLKGNSFILRLFVVLIFILMITSKVFSIFSPLFLGSASTQVFQREFYWATIYLIWFATFAFIGKLLKEVYGILYSHVQQSAYIELQESVFEKFHQLSYEWYTTKNAGGILRTVDRGAESANSLMNTLLVFIIPAIIEGVVTCAIFVFKFKSSILGSVLYIGLVVYIYVTIKITKWRKRIRTKANRMDNIYHDIASDSLANYETVKYFNNENFEIKRFCDALSNFKFYNLKILNSLGLLNAVQHFVLNVTLFFALYCAIDMIIKGEADNGILVTVIVYITNVFAPLIILGTHYSNIVKSFTDINDLISNIREKVHVSDDSHLPLFQLTSHEKKFGVNIEFENVSFHYPTQPLSHSLKNVNIFIPAGTSCAVVGHTGAGKTTISKLLYRFYDGVGEIKIGGRNISQYNRNSVRNIIGIVPQDTVLFNETIRYNILYGKLDATEEELIKSTKSAQLYDFIQNLPKKWDTIVGDRGIKLSGGERQRVSIARCLLKNPKIVIFDEATSLLDSKTEYLFQKAVEDLRKNRTLIIIAHRLSTILTSEQVILLNKGEVIERGNHQTLLELNGEYAQLWNIQSKSDKGEIIINDKDRGEMKEEKNGEENSQNDEQNKRDTERSEIERSSDMGHRGPNRSESRRCPFSGHAF